MRKVLALNAWKQNKNLEMIITNLLYSYPEFGQYLKIESNLSAGDHPLKWRNVYYGVDGSIMQVFFATYLTKKTTVLRDQSIMTAVQLSHCSGRSFLAGLTMIHLQTE